MKCTLETYQLNYELVRVYDRAVVEVRNRETGDVVGTIPDTDVYMGTRDPKFLIELKPASTNATIISPRYYVPPITGLSFS